MASFTFPWWIVYRCCGSLWLFWKGPLINPIEYSWRWYQLSKALPCSCSPHSSDRLPLFPHSCFSPINHQYLCFASGWLCGSFAGGVRKGEVQAEWGVEPGNCGWLEWLHAQGYRAQWESSCWAQGRESWSSCKCSGEECDVAPRVRTSGLPTQPCRKEAWRSAGIGDRSCFQSTSSSLMTSVASEAFWRAKGSLLSGHTGSLHGTIRALDVLFLWDLAAAEGRPTCLFLHCPLVLHSGRGLFSLFAFGVCLLISKTPLNLDKPSYPFTFHSCNYFYITFWFFIFFWKEVYF